MFLFRVSSETHFIQKTLIDNDKKVLPVLYRILRNDGILIIMIPIIEGWKHTYENISIVAESDREEHFGQNDHVRYYGSDIRERITSHGFEIEEDTAYGEEDNRYLQNVSGIPLLDGKAGERILQVLRVG